MPDQKDLQEKPLFNSIPDETPLPLPKRSKLLNILVAIGILYGLAVSVLGTAYNATLENLSMLLTILFAEYIP